MLVAILLSVCGGCTGRGAFQKIPPHTGKTLPSGARFDASAKWLSKEQMGERLIHLGFDSSPGGQDDLERARALLQSTTEFRSDGYQIEANSRWGMCYCLLFKSDQDALDFCALRRKGLAAYNPAIRDKVDSLLNVCRRRNFVAIFASEEKALRVDLAAKLWDFSRDESGL